MAESKNSFTFFWKIRNISFFIARDMLVSPIFFVQSMDETKWKLSFFSKFCHFKDCFACYFHRVLDARSPEKYKLDYELAFLTNDGSVIHSEVYLQKEYRKGDHEKCPLYFKREEMLMNKALLIPDDVLTIRCRMWNRLKPISQSDRCFAETRIETECQTFTGAINIFSNSETMQKSSVCMKYSSTENFLSSMNLYVVTNGKLVVEIELVKKTIERYRCKIFIQDVIGNKTEFGQGEFYNTNPQFIQLALSKDYLIENKDNYLPDDVLTIICEITFSTEDTAVKVDELKYEFDYKDSQDITFKATSFTSKEHSADSSTTLIDDLTLLFSEGILYDTKLKTATETFPAHTIVLSARSSVFKSMFTTDMEEKTSKCVDIDDLDADTVRRMLSFMYSDTLEDLHYESAKSLYFAADKYNIISLTHKCLNFLKQSLQQSNCCDTLLLAYQHHDEELKNAVQDFIAKNDEVFLFSDEWKNLEQNNPRLTIEVLRAVYMKNRKS